MIEIPFFLTIEVPDVGEANWGPKVNDALQEIVDKINALRPGERGGIAVLDDGGLVLDGSGRPVTGGSTTTPGTVIDDTTPSSTRTYSSVKITAIHTDLLKLAKDYADQKVSGSVLPTNLVVLIDQNADGTWPQRGTQAATTKVIWRGLTVPPISTGYAIARDSAILVKPTA
jgi:hypothetical protein